MDWLWPLYREHMERVLPAEVVGDQELLKAAFFRMLSESIATLYVMEPHGDTIVFKALGQWPLATVPELLYDPNGFIDQGFGGGKYKVNFHHGIHFVCTHNFRTYSPSLWREMDEVILD